ncbi:MAG TPA: Calx-beta domain-containing protein [Pyrinomonadaceae bacterium]|nr:Calx-beta domain-containing protein [Pyrinomonadaceae bacterium]
MVGIRISFLLVATLVVFINPGRQTASAQGPFSINGRVTEISGTDVGISGVTLTLTLNTTIQRTAQTDSNGDFSFPNIAAGSDYNVVPSKPNFTFSPIAQGGTNLQGDRTLFFSGSGTTTSTVQFSAATLSETESDSSITLTVTRSGGSTAGAASVDYATSDTAAANNCNVFNSAASSRCDYITTLGTLNFAANETSKNISIPLVNDSYAEGSETFTVSLSNAIGTTLGSPGTTTITINDNETVTGVNPIDQATFFVRLHYIDFFSREPDAAGLAFWSNQITSCGTDTACTELRRVNVSAAFFISIEFQETGYLVYRMYKAYGNLPGAPVPVRLIEFLPDTQQIGRGVVVGQQGWEQALENNKNAFAATFVSRPRFTTAYPTALTPADFVAQFFTNAGVPTTAAERQPFVDEFGGAANTVDSAARARALRRMAEQHTLTQQEFNKAFVLMQYFGYLRRNPNDPPESTLDFQGYNFWLNKLNQFNRNFVDAEMVKAFITSGEYRQRFGP